MRILHLLVICALVFAASALGAWAVVQYVASHLSGRDVLEAFGLGVLTLIRVLVLIALAVFVAWGRFGPYSFTP